MKRNKPLRADPAKVRAFVQRGRGGLERSGFRRSAAKALAAKREVRALEGPLDPAEWRRQVFEASGRRCVVTGTRARDAADDRFHAHHPVSQDALRRRGLYGRLWDPRNGVLVAEEIHMGHEHTGGEARIPREKLLQSVWDFARELDAEDGTSWATEHVKRKHPAAGTRGILTRGATDGEGD